jgi:hypothetical protein
MQIEEAKTILGVLAAAYAQMTLNEHSAKLFAGAFKSYDVQIVKRAVYAHIKTSKWPPTIADIQSILDDLIRPADERVTAADALTLVKRAVQRFGYYRESEGIASLPNDVQAAARAIGWKEICTSENPEALRAHFCKAFEQIQARTKRETQLGIAAAPMELIETLVKQKGLPL